MKGVVIYQSNRLEWLADCLTHRIRQARRNRFSLVPDVVLVNNYELAQWLSIRMAEGAGVCANIRFRLVGSYIWELAEAFDHPDQQDNPAFADTFTRVHLRWLSYLILSNISKGRLEGTVYEDFRCYLNRHGPVGAFELAKLLADLFDRYMHYRPDMLLEWESGSNAGKEEWQPHFWRQLSTLSQGRFRLEKMVGLIERLMGKDARATPHSGALQSLQLPERLYLFGLSYLPPLHLEVLKGLSDRTRLEIYHLSPCREYWFHIVSKRKQAKLARKYKKEALEEYFPVGNPLLASLGLCGRRFLNALYEMDISQAREHFRHGGRKTILSFIQSSIVDLGDPTSGPDSSKKVFSSGDDSVQIHVCHSRFREVEVIHDRLVGLFRSDADLRPHEVAVLAPDISKYAKAIEAVFGSAPKERAIPWSLFDVGNMELSQEIRAFLAIMDIPAGDFTAPELVDILSIPCVMKRLGLDEDSLVLARRFVRDSGICRGLQRISETSEDYINTWLFGIDRLMASAFFDSSRVCEDETGPFPDFFPVEYPVEGEAAAIACRLSAFVFGMGGLSRKIRSAQDTGLSPSRWLQLFKSVISQFISEDISEDRLYRELIQPLEMLCGNMSNCDVESVEYEVMRRAVKEEFSRPLPPRAFISGKMIFSSLVPMRAIPFKVICIMGMNHGDFPRQITRPAFDLMNRAPRPLDPSPYDEDRYLFLETLLSARKKFIISYVGKTQKDDTPLEPSSVVSELLDFLSNSVPLDCKDDLRSDLVVNHPLQPFSHRYLGQTDPRKKTYAYEWLPVDEDGHLMEQKDPEPFCSKPLPEDACFLLLSGKGSEDDGILSSTPLEIARFLADPVGGFLKKLNIDVHLGQMALSLHEPFSITDKIDQAVLDQVLAKVMQECPKGEAAPPIDQVVEDERYWARLFKEFSMKGLMPHGRAGMLLWRNKVYNTYLPFIKEVAKGGFPVDVSDADQLYCLSSGKKMRIKGEIGKTDKKGALIEFTSSLSEYFKFIFWTLHLLNCIELGPEHALKAKGRLISWKNQKSLKIRGIGSSDAAACINTLIETYFSSIRGEIYFLPAGSYNAAKVVQPKDANSIVRWNDLDEVSRNRVEKAALQRVFSFKDQDGMRNLRVSYMFRGSSFQLRKHVRSTKFLKKAIELCAPLFFYMESGR